MPRARIAGALENLWERKIPGRDKPHGWGRGKGEVGTGRHPVRFPPCADWRFATKDLAQICFRDSLGVVLGSLWNHVGEMLGLFLDNLGVLLEWFWDRFGAVEEGFWNHAGIILGSFWDSFGLVLVYLGIILE